MKIKVLFFGAITDVTQCAQVEISDYTSTHQLLNYLHEQYPLLQHYKFSMALNGKFMAADYALNEGDELALMPPFAGG
jgi:molybdopterin converting factor small subunit